MQEFANNYTLEKVLSKFIIFIIIMNSKVVQSNKSIQRVEQSSTKHIQRVGQMSVQNKPMNNKSVLPNVQEQTEQYNKYANK